MPGETVLIVDDDIGLRELIGDFLRQHGFHVREAGDVPSLRNALAIERPDLIILDLMMPGEDGLAALRTLDPACRPPVIMLSAAGTDVDRIVGLELGADDYLAKPCNPRELLARIRAVLRRRETDGELICYAFAGWVLDPAAHELTAPNGAAVPLTSNEFRLLEALVRSGRRVLSREDLIARLKDDDVFDRAIDLAVSRLRRKLAEHSPHDVIRTVRGEGYALTCDATRTPG